MEDLFVSTVNALKIVGLSVLGAVVYGMLHDQVTVQICPEYFTVGHRPVFGEQSPVMLAMLWGLRASFWAGLILGTGLALSATVGATAQYTAVLLLRPVLLLLLSMACCALIAGMAGFYLANVHAVGLDHYWSSRIAIDKQPRYLACGFAHNASYLVGFFGGSILIRRTWMSRHKQRSIG